MDLYPGLGVHLHNISNLDMAPNLNLHVDLNIVLDEEYCFEWELQRSCQCNS